ncbi:hypothetical protein llap_16870 [Limosa lapponica baueri]|uniref:PH domain-containing protein n=1 Tax=Limosa lapponica baueri TaxID=1758121 RepID=A0A2I0TGC7_LIMLA|nr:hypothetical protein llap_16870 [Limosa lapponica baueri]
MPQSQKQEEEIKGKKLRQTDSSGQEHKKLYTRRHEAASALQARSAVAVTREPVALNEQELEYRCRKELLHSGCTQRTPVNLLGTVLCLLIRIRDCKIGSFISLLEMSTEAEQQLLHDARNGNAEEVKQLLDTMNKGEIGFDINCKGRSKSNMGWTPLHLACYFGHAVVVDDLLKAGADVNVLNDMGDTPLHRAAFTGRKLNKPKPPDINCTDQMGNTPLHCAAYRAHKHCALKLLKNGADPKIRNKNDQTPLDLAQGAEMKLLLGGKTGKVINKPLRRYEGLLWKNSRFFGWKLYWIVLEHGVLSWYRRQADAVNNDHRQGCKHLTQAVCTVKSTDSCFFSVRCFDDTVHRFKIPKNSLPSQTRESWLEAIEDHSAYSTHYCTQEQLSSDDEEDDTVSVTDLQDTLKVRIEY